MAVRYLVIETGPWFRRRKVLISPAVLGVPDWTANTIPVLLTKEQVQNSPDVDADRPVSRQQELAMIRHYGWADHLTVEPFPPSVWTDVAVSDPEPVSEETGDQHLRSAKEVAGYSVDASDGPFGTILDFIIDERRWGMIDLAVKADFSPADRKVLIPTQWVSAVSWDGQRVQLSQPLKKLETAGFVTEA